MHHSINKLKTKATLILRRAQLGQKYKHQYACHSDFDIIRNEKDVSIIWKNRVIAKAGLVSTMRNTFQGSCFTIAAGPSLNEVDFNQLSPFDCISLNCSINKFADSGFQPRHCIIVDRKVFENSWTCVEKSILSGAYCYFSSVGLSRICEREPSLLGKGNIFLIEAIGRQYGLPRPSKSEFLELYQNDPDIYLSKNVHSRGTIGFSLNAEKGFFYGKTVAIWAVQLGYYLGYKNNFIVGMDLGGTGQHYFDTANPTAIPYNFKALYDPYIKVCFEQAQRAAEDVGFSLYNLSRYSTLSAEIIEKLSFENAIEQASQFKFENL